MSTPKLALLTCYHRDPNETFVQSDKHQADVWWVKSLDQHGIENSLGDSCDTREEAVAAAMEAIAEQAYCTSD